MSLIRKISIVLYAFILLGLILYVANFKVGEIFLFIAVPLLCILLYCICIDEFKKDETYFTHSFLNYVIFALAILSCILFSLNFLSQIFHWKGNEFIRLFLFGVLALNGAFILIDIFINFKRKKKIYGFQYFLLLLPLILFIGNIRKGLDHTPDDRDEKLIQLDYFNSEKVIRMVDENKILQHSLSDSLGQIRLVHNLTEDLINSLWTAKTHLVKITGGRTEDGYYVGAKEKELIQITMVGQDRRGHAYKLKESLDSYCNFLKDKGLTSISLIAKDAKDEPLYAHHPKYIDRDFAHLHFAQTTLLEALNSLTHLQCEVLLLENKYLAHLLTEQLRTKNSQP